MRALAWGMFDYASDEVDRADFKGDKIKSFIDGKDTYYFPTHFRRLRQVLSAAVVAVLIALVICVVRKHAFAYRYDDPGDLLSYFLNRHSSFYSTLA